MFVWCTFNLLCAKHSCVSESVELAAISSRAVLIKHFPDIPIADTDNQSNIAITNHTNGLHEQHAAD